MATLKENMEAIKLEKDTKISPENLKSGVTAFGVTGIYTGDVLLFDSMDSMNASEPAVNTYGVVMSTILEPLDEADLPFDSITLLDTVVLSETVTTEYSVYAGDGSGSALVIQLTPTSCILSNQITSQQYATYSSSDGKLYHKVSSETEVTLYETITTFYPGYETNRLCLEFLVKEKPAFLGIYQYTSDGWVLAENQFTGTAQDVFMDKIVYSAGGAVTGTLGTVISDMFDDASAKIYKKAKMKYENMEPIVLTDTDTIKSTIQFVPTNSNGETLLDLSQRTNCRGLFKNCIELSEVAPLDLSNCKTATDLFTNCAKVPKIILNNVNSMTSWSYPFTGCKALKHLEINGDMKITTPGSLFDTLEGVEYIGPLSASVLTSAARLFQDCKSLVTAPNLNFPINQSYMNTFDGCESLVNVSVLDMSNVGSNTSSGHVGNQQYCMQEMFLGCISLSDESLNNILQMCINATNVTTSTYKTLAYIGLTEEQATKCQTLSNYEAFVAAGWTTGY